MQGDVAHAGGYCFGQPARSGRKRKPITFCILFAASTAKPKLMLTKEESQFD